MKGKSNAKPVKKSPMGNKPVKPSYEEPVRPKMPNANAKKKK
jgi:hypothetical protein